jgi:ABC-type branched-subunit amino acid transport system ATPase component
MGRKENWLDETLFETIRKIRSFGVTVLLVEQNLWDSLEIADRYYLIYVTVAGSRPSDHSAASR